MSTVLNRTQMALVRAVTLFSTLVALAPFAAAETITIYRDDFGVPHIYADSLEGMAYAAGYAQAEDRLEEMLRNYRKAAGTMCEAFGADHFRDDYSQRVWQHEKISRERFGEIDPQLQGVCRAYIEGVEHFMQEHPEQVPDWAPKLEPYYPVMLSRYIIWGWPLAEARGDLRRGGLRPDPVAYRGSNEWVVAPSRTDCGAVIAVIDPHLGWYGEFRFYEVRMYAAKDDFALSGASILGVPFPGLGHSQYCSVAMTTGGPDTADVYEETISEDKPGQYLVDGQWRDMTIHRDVIRIRDGEKIEERPIEIAYTHHGPVVAQQDGKAYSMALSYFDEVQLIEELFNVYNARSLAGIKAALATRQLMPQNVMVGTVDGDIFYVRTGRVPIRKHKHDPKLPVPGQDSANDFQGIHPFEDLVQITNPPQGYMQNCNIAPIYLMKDSPLTPDRFPGYIYNADDGPAHQRGAMVLERLSAESTMTLDKAMELAFCTEVFRAGKWQERIKQAWQSAPVNKKSTDATTIYNAIQDWNRHSDPDSIGALAYYAFKSSLRGSSGDVEVPADLADENIIEALAAAAERIRDQFGRLDATFGDLFRVGRIDGEGNYPRTYPVGGGSLAIVGMATPRAISFGKDGDLYVGRGGQTSTQIVVLTKPPQSYTVIPLGESDHPDSGHWDDQAQKLFSQGKAKPTYFMDKAALEPHVTRETKLEL